MIAPLLNIDKFLKKFIDDDLTGPAVDPYICAHAYNLTSMEMSPPFILGLVTYSEDLWRKILSCCNWLCWLRQEGIGIAIFEPNSDCGLTRIYQCTPGPNKGRSYRNPYPENYPWRIVESEMELLKMLYGDERPKKYDSWVSRQREIYEMPTQLAEGRLANTSVEKAIIYSKGNGCVFCGESAPSYAGTTICDGRLFIQLSLCSLHLIESKSAPNVLSIIAELFHAKIDLPELQKFDHIPDEHITSIADFLAEKLNAKISKLEKRKNGWNIVFTRVSGWSWILRLNALHDYAYMLMDPEKNEKYRIDSAPDHPDVAFGPSHQHSHPRKNKDEISPSFTYGVPIFDVVILNTVASRLEADTP